VPELGISPASQIYLSGRTKIFPVNHFALAGRLHFGQETLGAEHKHIRILRANAIDQALALKIYELGIGFVGGNYVWNTELLEFPDQSTSNLRRDVDGFLEKFVGLLWLTSLEKLHALLSASLPLQCAGFFRSCFAREMAAVKHKIWRNAIVPEYSDSTQGICDSTAFSLARVMSRPGASVKPSININTHSLALEVGKLFLPLDRFQQA